jgi:hypothetical protein
MLPLCSLQPYSATITRDLAAKLLYRENYEAIILHLEPSISTPGYFGAAIHCELIRCYLKRLHMGKMGKHDIASTMRQIDRCMGFAQKATRGYRIDPTEVNELTSLIQEAKEMLEASSMTLPQDTPLTRRAPSCLFRSITPPSSQNGTPSPPEDHLTDEQSNGSFSSDEQRKDSPKPL